MDEKMIKKAINGDDKAFLQLMDLHKIALYKTALAYLRNEQDALEAIQEVTFRAYQNISKLREPSYIKTWLIRIMINYCNDFLKRRKRFYGDDKLLQKQLWLENYEHMELLDAMKVLDEQAKEVITLKYFHDLKIKEISLILNRPEGTIKTWLNRALSILRDHLNEQEVKRDVHK